MFVISTTIQIDHQFTKEGTACKQVNTGNIRFRNIAIVSHAYTIARIYCCSCFNCIVCITVESGQVNTGAADKGAITQFDVMRSFRNQSFITLFQIHRIAVINIRIYKLYRRTFDAFVIAQLQFIEVLEVVHQDYVRQEVVEYRQGKITTIIITDITVNMGNLVTGTGNHTQLFG
ncbi:hypothetical protein D3C72_1418110 [compost metagenome]